jgi:hypothetical protein
MPKISSKNPEIDIAPKADDIKTDLYLLQSGGSILCHLKKRIEIDRLESTIT